MKRLSIPTTASPQCLEVPEGIERSRLGSLHVQPGLTLTVTDGEAAIVLRAVPGVRMRDVKERAKTEAITIAEVNFPVEISVSELEAAKSAPKADLVAQKIAESDRRSKRKDS